MRIECHPADKGGCGHYRMMWPAQAATAAGADVTVSEEPLRAVCERHADPYRPDTCLELLEVPEADVVVLQRPLRSELVTAIPHLQKAGIAVVVEIDDDFSAIHPSNVAWPAAQPYWHPKNEIERMERETGKAVPIKQAMHIGSTGVTWYHVPGWRGSAHFNHLATACRLADLVTVSTPALAKVYGRHGRCVVLPNYVPARYLTVAKADKERHAIGWTGSIQTHPEDLEVMGGAWGRFVTKNAEFWDAVVVGAGAGVPDRTGLDSVLASGWTHISDYPAAMAQLDIGLVPLKQSRFNAAKSWLKGLEFGALGVPFIASPTPQYEALAKLGIGQTTRTDSWDAKLADLAWLGDRGRAELGQQYRDRAAGLTIEAHAERWIDAWHLARRNHAERWRHEEI